MITNATIPGPLIAPLNGPIVTAARYLLFASVFFMPISTAATNICMALTLIAWLASGQWALKLAILRGHWVVYSVLAIFGLSCIGSLYSSGSLEDIVFQLHKNARLLFLIPALSLLGDPVWRTRCLNAFIAAMLLTLTLSILSTTIPVPIVKGTAGGNTGNYFVFKDHIVQNLMMSFLVLMMLANALSSKRQLAKVSWYSLALFAVIDVLFFVQGRTGYISLAFNMLAFLLIMTHGRHRIIFIIATIIVSVLTFTYSTSFNQRLQITIKQLSERDKKELTSLGQRIEFTSKSTALILERPILGFGTGSYGREFCRVAETVEWCNLGKAHPHNQFMAMGVQFGLIGILVYLSLIASILWQSYRLPTRDRLLATGLALTLFVDSLTHAPLFLVTEAQFFTLMLAVVLANTHSYEKNS
jgi:O-antigen ligase